MNFILVRLPCREIGERLNLSERTVERHIYEALKYLEENLELYLIFLSFFTIPTDSFLN